MHFEHIPVLLKESIDGLNISPDGIYVDCTTGGGGHSSEILRRLGPGGRLVCLDRDQNALEAAGAVLGSDPRVSLIQANFADAASVLDELGIGQIDGALMDIGVSSHQFDEGDRGFSYQQDADLDMRMDQRQALTAKEVVNTYSEQALEEIFWLYGEEKWGRRIAQFILETRERQEISTTGDLVEIIKKAIPKKVREKGGHPAKRVFQALRIEVNGELEALEKALDALAPRLRPGGRFCVITFHSLEDRIVKVKFKDFAVGCVCPSDFPVCVCDHEKVLKVISRKPITASGEEVEANPRARSAKLRIAERV